MKNKKDLKICIVHDWLTTYAGAERVLEQILKIYPDSDLFSIVDFIPKEDRSWLLNKSSKTSFIQKMPFAKSKYRSYLPLMPFAIEQFDLSNYDLVISLSHAVAKGVLTGPNQIHVCLCFSPMRYAWDLQHQYLNESNLTKGFLSFLARRLLHKIRIWDTRTSNGVDQFIAISDFVARRIKKVYGRDSITIYPPVDTKKFKLASDQREDFYVTCSRMVPYKKIDLIVETFSKNFPNKTLIVIGDGPDSKKIKKLANTNIKFLGRASFDVLYKYLATAKAFIFAAEEDFGIAPLEAQSCGTPVIAYNKGGAKETIRGIESSCPSGVFFNEQTIESLSIAIVELDDKIQLISNYNCHKNALRFNEENFLEQFKKIVNNQDH